MRKFRVTTHFKYPDNPEPVENIVFSWQAPTEVRRLAEMLGDAFHSLEVDVDDRVIVYEWDDENGE